MTTVSIRINETEKEALPEFARKHDLSVSQVIRRAIKDFLLMDQMNKAVDALNKIPN